MNNKIIIGIVIFLLAGSILFFIFAGDEKETIKIGAILPLTGFGEVEGELMQNGILLAIKEVNDAGGINGKEIELFVEDSKTDTEEAKRAFEKIEAEHHPLFYISTFSGIGSAVGPLAEEIKAVMIVILATSDEVTEGKNWVFKYPQSASAEVDPVLFHFENLGIKRLGIIYLNDAFGKSIVDVISEASKEAGGTVESISFESDEENFDEYISQLDDTDAIYFVGFPPHLEAYYLQVKRSGYTGYLLGDSSIATIGFDEPYVDGIYVAAWGFFNPNFIFAREASKRYEDVYGEPMDLRSAGTYDIIHIIADLFEGEELSRGNIQSVFDQGFINSGVLGEVNVLPGERNLVPPLFPARIVGGELEYLK